MVPVVIVVIGRDGFQTTVGGLPLPVIVIESGCAIVIDV